MNRRQLIVTATGLVVLTMAARSQSAWWPFGDEGPDTSGPVLEITWNDLIPDDFVQPEDPFNTLSTEAIEKLLDGSAESNAELERMQEAFSYAPVVDDLNGKRVKLAAYVTPLEFDGQTRMKEFLLVPYMGACIHTPPPPANQVVHAEARDTIELQAIYDPIWAVGTLYAETVRSNLAESGYRLALEEVLPYR